MVVVVVELEDSDHDKGRVKENDGVGDEVALLSEAASQL